MNTAPQLPPTPHKDLSFTRLLALAGLVVAIAVMVMCTRAAQGQVREEARAMEPAIAAVVVHAPVQAMQAAPAVPCNASMADLFIHMSH